jgi:hypothetical protein
MNFKNYNMANVMDTMTENEKSVYRQIKLKEMHDFNKDFMDDLVLIKKDFNMKFPFMRDGVMVVGLFDNEFRRPKGFYFELIDSDLEPIDSTRPIYRVPYNEFYADEFEMDERSKFLVPVDQLKKINRQAAAIQKELVIVESDRDIKENKYIPPKPPLPFSAAPQEPVVPKLEDAPYSEMTIRDYIAIHTGRPISNKAWLNEIVKTK